MCIKQSPCLKFLNNQTCLTFRLKQVHKNEVHHEFLVLLIKKRIHKRLVLISNGNSCIKVIVYSTYIQLIYCTSIQSPLNSHFKCHNGHINRNSGYIQSCQTKRIFDERNL